MPCNSKQMTQRQRAELWLPPFSAVAVSVNLSFKSKFAIAVFSHTFFSFRQDSFTATMRGETCLTTHEELSKANEEAEAWIGDHLERIARLVDELGALVGGVGTWPELERFEVAVHLPHHRKYLEILTRFDAFLCRYYERAEMSCDQHEARALRGQIRNEFIRLRRETQLFATVMGERT